MFWLWIYIVNVYGSICQRSLNIIEMRFFRAARMQILRTRMSVINYLHAI